MKNECDKLKNYLVSNFIDEIRNRKGNDDLIDVAIKLLRELKNRREGMAMQIRLRQIIEKAK